MKSYLIFSHVRMFGVVTIALGAVAANISDPPQSGIKVVLCGDSNSERAPHGSGNVYAPCVLHEGNRYRMWYGGQGADGHDRIHYAESRDGIAWTRKGVVLHDPNANHVNDPCVLKVGGVYFMYFTRTQKDVIDRIDVATSKDAITWNSNGVALAAGANGAWDELSVGRPSVIHESGIFRLWYDGRKDFPPGAPVTGVLTSSTSQRSVGYATSSDGLHFTRRGANPVLSNDVGGVDVKRCGTRLVMAYESREGTRFAISNDGTGWTVGGLLAETSGTTIDAFGDMTPCLLVDDDGEMRRPYVGVAPAATWDHNSIAVVNVPAGRLPSAVSRPRTN